MVLVVAGVLAAYAMPRLGGLNAVGFEAWHNEVLSSLQYARNAALSHRRLVCVSVAAQQLSVRIASVNPATACDLDLQGPHNGLATVSTHKDVATSVSPAGVLYMQPDGRITTDGAGLTTGVFTVSMNGAAAVVMQGETGHVQ